MISKPNRVFMAVAVVLGIASALGIVVGRWNIAHGTVIGTLRAVRLSPLPETAIDVFATNATTHGKVSRVNVEFEAPLKDIDAWIKRSPGAQKIIPSHPTATTNLYTLPPPSGEKSASITVDTKRAVVEIELDHRT